MSLEYARAGFDSIMSFDTEQQAHDVSTLLHQQYTRKLPAAAEPRYAGRR